MTGTPPSTPMRFESVSTLRVRYCECDPMNVAHHASYIPWFEIGRTDLLRDSGFTYAMLETQGVLLVVAKLAVQYRRPARYDDLIEVRTKWCGGSRVKIEHEYTIEVIEPGVATPGFVPFTAAAATTTLGCVDKSGSIRPLPPWLVYPKDQTNAGV
jgi:acyl-CoA thioester hydrolase